MVEGSMVKGWIDTLLIEAQAKDDEAGALRAQIQAKEAELGELVRRETEIQEIRTGLLNAARSLQEL